MRFILILLGINFSSAFSQGEQFTVKDLYQIEKLDMERLGEGLELWKIYINQSLDSALIIAQHLVDLSEDQENQSIKAQSLFLLGKSQSLLKERDLAKGTLTKANQYAIEGKNKTLQSTILLELGAIYSKTGALDRAINTFLEAHDISSSIQDTLKLYKICHRMAGIYYNMDLYKKATEYVLDAERYSKSIESRFQREILFAKSAIFSGIGRQYGRLAKSDTTGRASILKDSMLYYLNKVIQDKKMLLAQSLESQSYTTAGSVINNLVDSYIYMHDDENALKYALQAEGLISKGADSKIIAQCKFNLANLYLGKSNYSKAIGYAKESLAAAKIEGQERMVDRANSILSFLYKRIGNYEEALDHMQEHNDYQNKINNQNNKRALSETEAKYQNEVKAKQILQQEKDIVDLESKNRSIAIQRNSIIGGGLLLSLLGFFGFRMNKLRNERNDKKAFAEALIFAQEEERKRIAQDLHDGIGQSLLLIKKQMESNQSVNLENKSLITETLEEVRSISRDLHPFQLDKFGLSASLEGIFEKVEQSTDLFLTKEMENIDNQLPKASEIHLFRTVQEAMSNIIKHAEATAAKINIQNQEASIFVQIQDNGKGFDHELAIAKSKSLGLKTMHERISAIGGKIVISKSISGGVSLEITLPKNQG